MLKQLAWDYTKHANTYIYRPDYATGVIDSILEKSVAQLDSLICEVGAGDGHLTKMLAKPNIEIHSIEPNEKMRTIGKQRTAHLAKCVSWFNGTGENTGKAGGAYQLVIFGSSFNVTDRQKSLEESARILKPGGWFSCLWNHRDLRDPLQSDIENIIKDHIPDYSYGSRREDQTAIIEESGLFGAPEKIEGTVFHCVDREQWLKAWQSHATLSRQAGNSFLRIIESIESHVNTNCDDKIEVPYITRAWIAPVLK